ncbi:hypothetical protein ACFQMM_18775 [Saliphagus sp. GCM10025308]
MDGDDRLEAVDDVLDTLETTADRSLTPEDVQALKRAVFEDHNAFIRVLYSDRSYFVIGSYGDEEETRLVAVRDVLDERRSNDHAFLMKEVPEFTTNFALKFHVLVRRVDTVVGVFEHNRGGHEWEAGALSHPPLREKTWALKRAYENREAEYEAFDAMIAHFFELLDEDGRLLEWSSESELRERTDSIP